MKIIAFGHRKRVGKDTAARFLCTWLRTERKCTSITKAGFADKLKDVCYQLYKWAGLKPGPWYEETENQALKEVVLPKLGKSPRRIWIDFGTKVAREVYSKTWLDYLFESVNSGVLIVTDMRFCEEADAVGDRGGYRVKLNRIGYPHTPDEADEPLADYKNWDAELDIQDGDLSALHSGVLDLAQKWGF